MPLSAGVHRSGSFGEYAPGSTSMGCAKSRGSTGNMAPPIRKERLCGMAQSNVSPRRLDIWATTSCGPRISEFPC